jgi:hypothetical protein
MQEYIPQEETKPFWQEAVRKILDRFESVGYGAEFTHEELKAWMGIDDAKEIKGYVNIKEQFDYMRGIEAIKAALLSDYNLFFYSYRSVGYSILRPSDQITVGADYYIRKSQKALTKAATTLTNVDVSELGTEDRSLQLQKIGRMAFIKSAFRKRRISESRLIEGKK